jgi:hypothetical protein
MHNPTIEKIIQLVDRTEDTIPQASPTRYLHARDRQDSDDHGPYTISTYIHHSMTKGERLILLVWLRVRGIGQTYQTNR